MVNKLIESFLQDPKHYKLYLDFLENPTESNKNKIESYFKLHVIKLKLLSYFSRVLFYEAQRFDKKIRATATLPFLDGDNIETTASSDLNLYEMEINDHSSLENHFENERLFNLISNLKDSNKQLLYLLYVKDLDETQAANFLGITKQAVNKRKNTLLKNIRRIYLE